MNYEAVIGLEVHVQIKTASKVFTRVATGYGHEPNTLTDPTVLALPGALPVMNKAALDAIIKAGLLLDCKIAPVCKWDRKNYFYPDSPKNYQISQYDQPICLGGSVEIELPGSARNIMGEHKKIPLTRIHLEEDVGKLNHGTTDSLVDYNRAGTPLMEIVSDPAMHTADEAFAYLTSLRATMIYGGISDCDMEKGQLRCDANISIRPVGQTTLGTKVELKNLNSISFVRAGIEHEIKRQLGVLERGGTIVQETRDYDGMTGTSQSLRTKEEAHDYRYFPDPDLMPVKVTEEWLSSLRAELEALPPPPFERQRIMMEDYKISYPIASVIREYSAATEFLQSNYQILSQYGVGGTPTEFNFAALSGMAPSLPPGVQVPTSPVNLMQVTGSMIVNGMLPLSGTAAFASIVPSQMFNAVDPSLMAQNVYYAASGIFPSNITKEVFKVTLEEKKTPAEILEQRGLFTAPKISDELEQWCRDSIAANAKALAEFKAGKDSAINAFKGPIMKAAKGKANPKLVDETLRRLLAAM